jgi:hypothetical protein
MNQCQLVDKALAGQGFPPAAPTVADAKRTCGARKSIAAAGGDTGLSVAISLQNGQKYLDSITKPDSARTGKLNGRPFVQQREPVSLHGGCQIALAVGDNARVLIVVTSGDDTAGACTEAQTVASAIEPELPKI